MMAVDPIDHALSRRETLKWAGIAATALGVNMTVGPAYVAASTVASYHATRVGYGKDPLMMDPSVPWPLTLSSLQKAIIGAAADAILPGDATMPSASAQQIDAFFDEWFSAPYAVQQADRASILPMLTALQHMAQTRSWKQAIVAGLQGISPYRISLLRFRALAAAGCYTTPVGMKAIGFIGDEPRATFDGPPAEVLEHLEAAFAALGPVKRS